MRGEGGGGGGGKRPRLWFAARLKPNPKRDRPLRGLPDQSPAAPSPDGSAMLRSLSAFFVTDSSSQPCPTQTTRSLSESRYDEGPELAKQFLRPSRAARRCRSDGRPAWSQGWGFGILSSGARAIRAVWGSGFMAAGEAVVTRKAPLQMISSTACCDTVLTGNSLCSSTSAKDRRCFFESASSSPSSPTVAASDRNAEELIP